MIDMWGNNLKIEIMVRDPGEGYDTPRYGPLYLPVTKNTVILIGQCWVPAPLKVKTHGGTWWIYAEKKNG